MIASSRSQVLGMSAVVTLLTGCGGGSQLGSNQIQPNAHPMNLARVDRASGTRPAPGRSWMAPEAKKTDLAYILNFYSSEIFVFTYPRGKYVGSILGATDPQGLCAAKTGNWWAVSSGSDQVLEYAHGGTTPLKTLNVTAGEPAGCSVDPTTGNLAVTILGTGDVVVFTQGSGSGTTISDGLTNTYFDGYDNKGDLFVDGFQGSTPGLAELPKGSGPPVPITLSQPLGFPGGVQWHAKYLAVGDQENPAIYHFAIRGRNAKKIGVTQLTGSDIVGFWIQKPDVVAADAGNGTAAIWKYPSGGSPIKMLQGPGDLPIGATVSVAK
jgi:hypothetical protein